MSASIVVLNQSYHFWDEIDLEGFFSLLSRKVIEIIKVDDDRIIGTSDPRNKYLSDILDVRGSEKMCVYDLDNEYVIKIKMPLIVRLLDFIGYKSKSDVINFNEAAVYNRDDNICQYYHEYKLDEDGNKIPCKPYKYRCSSDDRTIDHVMPISRGGKNSFENCVTACLHCNTVIKKNKTPEEVGLKLIRKPFIPLHKKGEMVLMRFNYNPKKKSHRALFELLGYQHT
jgi:5-methylcytosine-specific restriction endonuclease McrA